MYFDLGIDGKTIFIPGEPPKFHSPVFPTVLSSPIVALRMPPRIPLGLPMFYGKDLDTTAGNASHSQRVLNLEPIVNAILRLKAPTLDISTCEVDIVTDKETLLRILEFCSSELYHTPSFRVDIMTLSGGKGYLLEWKDPISRKPFDEIFNSEARLRHDVDVDSHFRVNRFDLGGLRILLLCEVDAVAQPQSEDGPTVLSTHHKRGRSVSSIKCSRAVSDYFGSLTSVAENDENQCRGDTSVVGVEATTSETALGDYDENSDDEEAIRRIADELKAKIDISDENKDVDDSCRIVEQPTSSTSGLGANDAKQLQQIVPASEHLSITNLKDKGIRVVSRGTSTGLEPVVDLVVRKGNTPRIDIAGPSLYFGQAKQLAAGYRKEHLLRAVNTFKTKKILVEYEQDSSAQDGLGKVVTLLRYLKGFVSTMRDADGNNGQFVEKFSALFGVRNDGFGSVSLRRIIPGEVKLVATGELKCGES